MKLYAKNCEIYIEYLLAKMSPFLVHWNACFYGWNWERNIGLYRPSIAEQNHFPSLSFVTDIIFNFYCNLGVLWNFLTDIPCIWAKLINFLFYKYSLKLIGIFFMIREESYYEYIFCWCPLEFRLLNILTSLVKAISIT